MLIIRNAPQDKFPFQFRLKKAKADFGASGRHQEVSSKNTPTRIDTRREGRGMRGEDLSLRSSSRPFSLL